MPGIGSVGLDACTWLNKYDATVQAMSSPGVVAGFGTDWALAAGMPPRWSSGILSNYPACLSDCEKHSGTQCPQQCGAPICNGTPASSTVQYNTVFQPTGVSFAKRSLGNQTWDYNLQGVAQYGMLPDFLQDVSTFPGAPGLASGSDVASSMMLGAQYFYQTWRIAGKVAASIPAVNLPPLTGGGGSGGSGSYLPTLKETADADRFAWRPMRIVHRRCHPIHTALSAADQAGSERTVEQRLSLSCRRRSHDRISHPCPFALWRHSERNAQLVQSDQGPIAGRLALQLGPRNRTFG